MLSADTLAERGEVTGLGRGERIYSVRFIGDLGYVVTFRQTDPLYALDLRDPAAPKVTGELKISGYSAYLHPGGPDRLIGIGQEADGQGRVRGTQISLFDVADPAAPRLLSRFHQRKSGSEAEWDPHAFLYWPPQEAGSRTGLAMVPLMTWGESAPKGASRWRYVSATAASPGRHDRTPHPAAAQRRVRPGRPGHPAQCRDR